MSFLTRIMQRAKAGTAAQRFVMPKGAARLISRANAPEEAEEPDVATMRRTMLRRQADTPPVEQQEAARAPAELPEGEEAPAQKLSLRRATEKPAEEEPVERSVRRAIAPPEETEEPAAARTVRRADDALIDEGKRPLRQPFQTDTMAGATPPHQDLSDMEEPSALQALRRDAAPVQTPAANVGQPRSGDHNAESLHSRPAWSEPTFTPHDNMFGGGEPMSQPYTAIHTNPPSGNIPQQDIIIDRVDVVIHEPMPPARAAASRPDVGRMMRSRYLQRL